MTRRGRAQSASIQPTPSPSLREGGSRREAEAGVVLLGAAFGDGEGGPGEVVFGAEGAGEEGGLACVVGGVGEGACEGEGEGVGFAADGEGAPPGHVSVGEGGEGLFEGGPAGEPVGVERGAA